MEAAAARADIDRLVHGQEIAGIEWVFRVIDIFRRRFHCHSFARRLKTGFARLASRTETFQWRTGSARSRTEAIQSSKKFDRIAQKSRIKKSRIKGRIKAKGWLPDQCRDAQMVKRSKW
jgi:hypothetical protein